MFVLNLSVIQKVIANILQKKRSVDFLHRIFILQNDISTFKLILLILGTNH